MLWFDVCERVIHPSNLIGSNASGVYKQQNLTTGRGDITFFLVRRSKMQVLLFFGLALLALTMATMEDREQQMCEEQTNCKACTAFEGTCS